MHDVSVDEVGPVWVVMLIVQTLTPIILFDVDPTVTSNEGANHPTAHVRATRSMQLRLDNMTAESLLPQPVHVYSVLGPSG
jgi:hypothetical protein